MSIPMSQQVNALSNTIAPFMRYYETSSYFKKAQEPDACDFAFGNPHDMPLAGLGESLRRWSEPHSPDWFAYKMNESRACNVVAASLQRDRSLAFDPADIAMTTGAFAALNVALHALVDMGEEVIFISPPWFFYEGLITAVRGIPVRVKVDPKTFDLDLGALEAAITPRTRAIIINSPNNPTGRIYPAETLQGLADVLARASADRERPIYLLSDEAYSRIVFDRQACPSPTSFYPHSLLIYTYGKTLLAPGQRIGYIALPPSMPEREHMRQAVFIAQVLTGYAFPNALMQYALEDLDAMSIDIPRLQRKRDHMVGALREIGYDVHSPEGTFYLLPRSPIPDDYAFTESLAARNVLCLPGTVVEMPGYFRISLTANEDMIERALPHFEAALQKSLTE